MTYSMAYVHSFRIVGINTQATPTPTRVLFRRDGEDAVNHSSFFYCLFSWPLGIAKRWSKTPSFIERREYKTILHLTKRTSLFFTERPPSSITSPRTSSGICCHGSPSRAALSKESSLELLSKFYACPTAPLPIRNNPKTRREIRPSFPFLSSLCLFLFTFFLRHETRAKLKNNNNHWFGHYESQKVENGRCQGTKHSVESHQVKRVEDIHTAPT